VAKGESQSGCFACVSAAMWNQERKKPRFLFSSFFSDSCAGDSPGRAMQSLLVPSSAVDAQADAIFFGERSSGWAFGARSSPAHARVIILCMALTWILLNRVSPKNRNGHCQMQI
jgi:hypothetical protein